MDLCLNISVQGMQRRGSDGHRLFVAWRPNGVTGKLPKWVALKELISSYYIGGGNNMGVPQN